MSLKVVKTNISKFSSKSVNLIWNSDVRHHLMKYAILQKLTVSKTFSTHFARFFKKTDEYENGEEEIKQTFKLTKKLIQARLIWKIQIVWKCV